MPWPECSLQRLSNFSHFIFFFLHNYSSYIRHIKIINHYNFPMKQSSPNVQSYPHVWLSPHVRSSPCKCANFHAKKVFVCFENQVIWSKALFVIDLGLLKAMKIANVQKRAHYVLGAEIQNFIRKKLKIKKILMLAETTLCIVTRHSLHCAKGNPFPRLCFAKLLSLLFKVLRTTKTIIN